MEAIDYYCKVERERTPLHIADDETIRHTAEDMLDLFDIMEQYANQRVVDELENIPYFDAPLSKEEMVTSNYITQRIKELRPTPLLNNDEPTNSDDGH